MKQFLVSILILSTTAVFAAKKNVTVGSFKVNKKFTFANESSIEIKMQKVKVKVPKGAVLTMGFWLYQDKKFVAYKEKSRGKTYSSPKTFWHMSMFYTRSEMVKAGLKLNKKMNGCVVAYVKKKTIGQVCKSFKPGGKPSKPVVASNTGGGNSRTEAGGSSILEKAIEANSRPQELYQLTNGAIKKGSRDPKLWYLRGLANMQLLNCEGALKDFKRATKLGLKDIRVPGGNDTKRQSRRARQCKKLLPVKATHPKGKNWHVAVRHRQGGTYARAAVKQLKKLGKVSKKLFGMRPPKVVIAIFENEEHASEFTSETGINVNPSISRPDATGFGGDTITLFESRKGGVRPRAADVENTVVHEYIHSSQRWALPYYSESSDLGRDWWVEGMATYGAEIHFGASHRALQDKWAGTYRTAKGIEKAAVITGGASFHGEQRYIGLYYNTGALMVAELVKQKGKGIIKKITAAQEKWHKFREVIPKITGKSQEEWYDMAVASAQARSGLNFEDRQYQAPRRSSFREGDIVLARNVYNRKVEYLPARFGGFRSGKASVYYFYGSSAPVPRNQVVHMNWKQGVKIRCRVDDNADDYERVTVSVATKKEVIFKRSNGGSGRVKIGKCNELGNGPKNR